MIHIDAGYNHVAVLSDLRRWWPILWQGSVMIMDDYDPADLIRPTVLSAVDVCFAVTAHEGFECLPYKCRVRKPVG